MKRIASILLLGILLFNWGGYRILTNYLEDRSDSRLEASFDENNYNESDLIHFKVAASLPYYYSSSENYERVNGEVVIQGVSYKYVKRRILNDSLELLCIPNVDKAGVQNASNDFYRLANDVVSNNSAKKSTGNNHTHLSKFSVQDFSDDHAFVWQYKTDDLSPVRYMKAFADVKSEYLSRLERPPQA